MKYLLAAALSIYSLTANAVLTDFSTLQDLEIARILVSLERKNDAVTWRALQLGSEQSEVLLNYLYFAALSAHLEQTFVRKYAIFQYHLAGMKDAAICSPDEVSIAAKEFALLNRAAQKKAELSVILKHVEEYIDTDQAYDDSIDALRKTLTMLMNSLLEDRQQAIDMMLTESENRLSEGTLLTLGRVCNILVSEPELLVRGDTLALGRVDVMHTIAREIGTKVASIDEVKQVMDEIVYFTLLITHNYFKACYTKLRQDYCDKYNKEPRLLFNLAGILQDEYRYVLPQELSA